MIVSRARCAWPARAGRPGGRPWPSRGALIAGAWAVGPALLWLPGAAGAQTASVLIDPGIDQQYDRDHNVSVNERAHPDFDSPGVRVSSFVLHPTLTIGPGFSDNVYLDNDNKKSDVYAAISPVISADSDWSNHYVGLVAAADLRRYANQALYDRNAWYVYARGRLDIHSDANVKVDAQLDRTFETPYTQDIGSGLVVPSTFLRRSLIGTGTYDPGRSRLVVTGSTNYYTFTTVRFIDGSIRDQAFRDQTINRLAATYEYALSPSVSVYGQATADLTSYRLKILADGLPNRDSTEVSISGGVNFDLSSLARGSIGLGYSRRRYDAATVYPVAQGLSGQVKVELFPTDLTTVTVRLQRQIQDVTLGTGGAYWNTGASVGVDHEVAANVIVSATAEALRRDYQESQSSTDVLQLRSEGRYQASRNLAFVMAASYGRARPHGIGLGNPFDELGVTLGVRLRD